jgi:hypothetical protein
LQVQKNLPQVRILLRLEINRMAEWSIANFSTQVLVTSGDFPSMLYMEMKSMIWP